MKKSRFSIFMAVFLSVLMLTGIVPISAFTVNASKRTTQTEPNYDEHRGRGMTANGSTGVMVYDDLKAYYKKSVANVALSTDYKTSTVNPSTGKNLASAKEYSECPDLYADWALYYDDDIEGNTVIIKYGLSMMDSVQYVDATGAIVTGQSPIELTASYGDATYNAGFEMVRDNSGKLRYTTRHYEEKGIIFYIINHSVSERMGQEDDVSILLDYLDQGYVVVTLDFKCDPNATSPYIEQSLVAARALFDSCTADAALKDLGIKTSTNYIYFLPEGCRLERDVWYWDTSIWGVNGTMEKYMDTWNNKIAGTSYDPAKIGKVSSVDEMIKVVTQTDGETPIEYKLCMNIVYPSKPKDGYEAPLYIQEGTNYTREQNIETSYTRGAYTGFALNGYACVQYDHPYWPFLYRSEYKFDNSGSNYGMAQSSENNARAAVRCARYYADALGYSSEYVGAAGISKATPGLSVLSIKNNKQLPQLPISGYDPSYFEGDIFEGRNRVKAIVQPFMYYDEENQNEVSSDCTVAYISSGNGIERLFGSGSYASYEKIPLVISGGTRDEYSCYNYWDTMVTWFTENTTTPFLPIVQLDQGHTFPVGYDYQFGYERFTAMVDFFDVYLKPDDERAPEVLWVTPLDGTENLPVSGEWTVGPYTPYGWDINTYYYNQSIQIRFLHAVDPESVNRGVTLRTEGGAVVEGEWVASQGDTLFTFVHNGLVAGLKYVIDITDSVESKNGVPLAEERKVSFKTEGTYALSPIADAYVSSQNPDVAYGSGGVLRVSNTDITLLTFSSENIIDAEKILLKAGGDVEAAMKLSAYALADYAVDEETLTYNKLAATDAWTNKKLLGTYNVTNGHVSLDLTELAKIDGLGDFVTIALVSADKLLSTNPYRFTLDFESPTLGAVLNDGVSGEVIVAKDGKATDAGSIGVTLNKPSSIYLWRRTGALSSGYIVKDTTGSSAQVFRVKTNVGEGQFVKFYNAVTDDYLTSADVGKNFRVTFGIRTNRTLDIEVGFSAAAAGDGSAKSPSASAFVFYGSTESVRIPADTWTTVSHVFVISSEMVTRQAGLVTVKLLYPTEDKSYTPITFIDNLVVEECTPAMTVSSAETGAAQSFMLVTENRGSSLNTPITVTFDEAMDITTFEKGITVTNMMTGDRVAGIWAAVGEGNKTFSFATDSLMAGTPYTVRATKQAKTLAGVACTPKILHTVVTEGTYAVKPLATSCVSETEPKKHFGLDAQVTVNADSLGIVTFSAKVLESADVTTLYMDVDAEKNTELEVYVLGNYMPDSSLCYDAIAGKLTDSARMGTYTVSGGSATLDLSILSKLAVGKNVTLAFKAKDGAATLKKDLLVLVTDTKATVALTAEDRPVTDKICDFAEIKAAQVTVRADVTVKFYVELSRTYADAKMRFTVNGKETLVDGEKIGGQYVFALNGIAYGEANDTIKAEVLVDGQVVAVKDSYSVTQNFKNLLTRPSSELGLSEEKGTALKALLADLVAEGISTKILRAHSASEIVR